jgi:hypothetical protein
MSAGPETLAVKDDKCKMQDSTTLNETRSH